MSSDGVRRKRWLQIFGGLSAVLFMTQSGHAHSVRKIHRPTEHRHAVVHHVAVHHTVRHERVTRRAKHLHHIVAHHSYHHVYHHLHHLIRRTGYVWCVPYARQISHIELKGDAFLWWAEAAGRYARGHRPEVGSILNFRPTHRMPLGHVAVVAKIINSREVLVNQANWVPDTITRDVPVIDVSANNDWSKVKVSVGDGRFGMIYPTFGFIYRQAPSNVVYASSGGTEVADAPVVHKIRLNAPNRTLR